MKFQLRFMQLLLTSNVGAFYSEKQIMQFPQSAKIVHFSLRNCWLHSSLSWCWIQMTEWDGHLLRRSTVPLWWLLFHSHHLSNMQHWKNPGEKVFIRRHTWSNLQLSIKPCVEALLKLNSCWADVAEARGTCFQQFVSVEDQAPLAPQRAPPPNPPVPPGNQVRRLCGTLVSAW